MSHHLSDKSPDPGPALTLSRQRCDSPRTRTPPPLTVCYRGALPRPQTATPSPLWANTQPLPLLPAFTSSSSTFFQKTSKMTRPLGYWRSTTQAPLVSFPEIILLFFPFNREAIENRAHGPQPGLVQSGRLLIRAVNRIGQPRPQPPRETKRAMRGEAEREERHKDLGD